MRVITICSTIAIILSPFALSHPEKLRARTGETKDENKDHISIAEEWLDNNRRQVPQWLPEPPKPNTKRLTLCKHNPPAVVRPAPASVPPPTRDSCSLLLQSLESEWLYFEKWTLVTEAGSSPPKQQPWIPAQYMKCVFLVTGWQPPKDGVGQKKKLTIEVGNDDVRQLRPLERRGVWIVKARMWSGNSERWIAQKGRMVQ
ncbi:hypothetical protein PG995_009413 [Apiospora arundinis]